MRHITKSTFGIGAIFAVLCCLHIAPARAAIAIQQGELRLDGTVASYDANAGNLVLNAASFTLASGKSSAINPTKSKDILLSAQTGFVNNAGANIEKPAIKIGQSIAVIGADGGSGNALKARLIIVTNAPQKAAPPKAAADASAKTGKLQPGEFVLNGQIKGIFSAETIIIEVFKRIDAAGKEEELGQPVEQKLHLDANTKIFSREDVSKSMTVGDIELGQRISVVGKYGGTDQPFNVRAIAVWKQEEQNLQKIGVVRISRQVGALLDRGESAYNAGAFPEALQYYRKAQQTAAAMGDTGGNALAQNSLGLTYGALDQPKSAIAAFQNAANLAASTGNYSTVGIAWSNLGDLYLRQGDAKNALSTFNNATNQMGSSHFPGKDKLTLQLLIGKSQALRHLDRVPEAMELLHQAEGMAQQQNDKETLFNCYTELGFMQIHTQQASAALQNAAKAKALIPQFKNPAQQADGWINLYLLYAVAGDKKQSQSSYTQAHDLLSQLKDNAGLQSLEQLKAKVDKSAASAQTH